MGVVIKNVVIDNKYNCTVQNSYLNKIYNYDSENNCVLSSISEWKLGKKSGEIYFEKNRVSKTEGIINFGNDI